MRGTHRINTPPFRETEIWNGNEESLPATVADPVSLSVFEAGPPQKIQRSNEIILSKLSFSGVSDKKNGHTGFFKYCVGSDGRIYCLWDPVFPREPFRISCSNRRELPWRLFDGSPREMQKLLSKITGPYTFLYDAKTSTALVTPKSDLDKKGYVLRNGKLVEVPLREAQQWHLHDGQGGPKLPKGVVIQEIQVANETIFARGSNNLMYLYSPGVGRRDRKVEWEACYGFLDSGSIRFPENMRDWTAGVSVQVKPWQRRGLDFTNPWTDVDSFYGQGEYKIAQGATITLGVIPHHGRTLQFWDTGLPGDLHRAILTPDRGRVQAVKVCQAASVWVIFGFDRDGKPGIYWRRENYEDSGACIGMEHSCDVPENRPSSSQQVCDLGEAIRLIPDPGWCKMEFPQLDDAAVITDRFSVHCTGEGDTSREIRFEGRNGAGEIGFYYKALEDSSWQFSKTDEIDLAGDIVPVGIADPQKATPYRITRDYEDASWEGLNNAPVANIALLEFHPYQTQSEESTLRFTLLSGKTLDVYFRTTDAWSPFKRERFEDDAVGQGVGVAKVLVGTLDIPEALLSTEDGELLKFVNTFLKPYHHLPNLFEVVADMDGVNIKTHGKFNQYRQPSKLLQLPRLSFSFSREATGETLFEQRAQSAHLIPTPSMSPAELARVVAANEAFLFEIHAFQNAVRSNSRRLSRRWGNVKALLVAVRAFTKMIDLRERPYVGAVLDLTPRLISAHRTAFKKSKNAKVVPQGILRAMGQVQGNLAMAKKLLEQ